MIFPIIAQEPGLSRKRPAEGVNRQPDQSAGRIDQHIDRAGRASRNEGLMEFIAGRISDRQEPGQGQRFQCGDTRFPKRPAPMQKCQRQQRIAQGMAALLDQQVEQTETRHVAGRNGGKAKDGSHHQHCRQPTRQFCQECLHDGHCTRHIFASDNQKLLPRMFGLFLAIVSAVLW